MTIVCPYVHLAQPTMKFCEENLCSWITAPANTWSNLAYVAVGAYVSIKGARSNRLLLRWLGLLAVLAGISSGLYHASFTRSWQIVDNAAMFLFPSLLLCFNLYRLVAPRISAKCLAIWYGMLNIASVLILYVIPTIFSLNTGIFIFVLEIVVVIISEYCLYYRAGRSYLLRSGNLGLAALLVAWIFWLLDYSRVWCDPRFFHIVNGHALWHIFGSISVLFLSRFYGQFDLKSTQKSDNTEN